VEFSTGPIVVAAQVEFLANDPHVVVPENPYPVVVILGEVELFVIVPEALEDLPREDAARPKDVIGLRDLSPDVLVGDPNLLHKIIILLLRDPLSLGSDTIAPAAYQSHGCRKSGYLFLQPGGQANIVAILACNVPATGKIQASIERARTPDIPFVANQDDSGICKSPNQVSDRFGGTIVENDEFEIFERLIEDASDRFAKVRVVIVHWHDHRNERRAMRFHGGKLVQFRLRRCRPFASDLGVFPLACKAVSR
jgi:hypothetical protein